MSEHIDVEKMRERLRNQQKILTERVEVEREKVEPSVTTNPDRTDMAFDYDYRGRRMSVIDQLEDQLVEVEQALERIEEGTYGICANCGQAIQAERLEALPSAALCIDCQRQEAAA
jgi:RNA polymerase-binding protein DksA